MKLDIESPEGALSRLQGPAGTSRPTKRPKDMDGVELAQAHLKGDITEEVYQAW